MEHCIHTAEAKRKIVHVNEFIYFDERDKLGEGSMATVFRGIYSDKGEVEKFNSNDTSIAVKRYDKAKIEKNKILLVQYQREIKILKKL